MFGFRRDEGMNYRYIYEDAPNRFRTPKPRII